MPWLAHTCGRCRFCVSGRENLCVDPRFTGWDLDGGYAEYAVVDEGYAYALPEGFGDEEVAPLLCAGIIGYRALQRANLPEGGRLGIYGFGGSAHITAQIALANGARVHVMTRSTEAQALALELGAASAGDADAHAPRAAGLGHPLRPRRHAGAPALAALDRGGTLAIAGIHLSDIPALNYQEHLFEERTLQSVTANTRRGRRGVPRRGRPHRRTRVGDAVPDGPSGHRAARPRRRPRQRRRRPGGVTQGRSALSENPCGGQNDPMTTPPTPAPHASDLARRIAMRREEVGMSVEELSTRRESTPATSPISRPVPTPT